MIVSRLLKKPLNNKNKDETPVPMKFLSSGFMTTPVATGSRAQMNISPVFLDVFYFSLQISLCLWSRNVLIQELSLLK